MLKITREPNYTIESIKVLSRGLDHNAEQKRGHKPVEDFAFFIRDAASKIVGGCNGIMYYGCLYIDQLWVDPEYRQQDYGSELIRAAEDLAKSHGCLFSTLETMDWEALDFYKKLGYYLELERRGYFKDSIMYSLRKDW